MMSRIHSALLSVLLTLPLSGAQQEFRRNSKDRTTTEKRSVLTGIVDQVGSRFVLAGEKNIRPRATLRAEGFNPDNFARFVGHSVQVRGRVLIEGSETVLLVRSVEDIKEMEPAAPNQAKREQTK